MDSVSRSYGQPPSFLRNLGASLTETLQFAGLGAGVLGGVLVGRMIGSRSSAIGANTGGMIGALVGGLVGEAASRAAKTTIAQRASSDDGFEVPNEAAAA